MAKTLGSKLGKALIGLLIERREAAGMTQTQPADRLGEYQSFIARLESGQRRVDVVEFLELAEVLGFDPGKVLAAVREGGVARPLFVRTNPLSTRVLPTTPGLPQTSAT